MRRVIAVSAIALVGVLSAFSTATARSQAKPSVAGPDVMIIGARKTGGSVRSFLVNYRDFPNMPCMDVHTSADGVTFHNLDIVGANGNAGTFQFTMQYTEASPATFTVEIYAHGGTGGINSGLKPHVIEVRRL